MKPLSHRPSVLRRRLLWCLPLPLLVGVALLWQTGRGEARSESLPTHIVQRTTLEDHITALGTLQAMNAVEVGTQVSGQLEKLHVQVGDQVKAQQLLAEIDASLVETRVVAGRAGLRQLRAQLQDRLAQADLANLQLKRNRTLLAHEAVTELAVQTAEATASSAQAQVEALRAQIEQAQAQLSGEETSLRYTRIHAPMAGTVVTLNVRAGQTVVASQQAPVLLRIADLSRMTVWAQVSEADVPAIRVGMPVEFNTLGLPERRWHGVVRQVLPTPETVNNVVLYNVLFEVDNLDGALKPQMSAQVSFTRARVEDALVVPLQALAKKTRAGTGKALVPPGAAQGDADQQAPAGKPDGASPPAATAKAATATRAGAGTQQAGADATPAKTARPGKSFMVQVLGADGTVDTRKVLIGLQVGGWGEVLAGLNEGDAVVLDSSADKAAKKPATKRADSVAATGTGTGAKLF